MVSGYQPDRLLERNERFGPFTIEGCDISDYLHDSAGHFFGEFFGDLTFEIFVRLKSDFNQLVVIQCGVRGRDYPIGKTSVPDHYHRVEAMRILCQILQSLSA